ncbi:MAG: hypothetical protein GF317_14230 [Candidatus Lokiarchaeota archaeon]|nr:hypothetical protein [Candidatus Lokiarchaeota archaeon]MBD3200774.1 hypothetical protein [Candidatus Lokiarchaeota archaeon]
MDVEVKKQKADEIKYDELDYEESSYVRNQGHIEYENINQKEEIVKSVWLEKKTFRIALLSMFTALSVVIAYALASIPNIELFTLSIFLGGFVLGKKEGLLIGTFSALIFVFLNPWGVSPLPLMIYQVLHYALTGGAGALTAEFFNGKKYYKPKKDLYNLRILILFGFIGAIITLSFDIITSLIGVIIAYGSLDAFLLYFLSGIVFTTIHEIGNVLGFIFILPGLIQLIYRLLH